ncbi:ankyrin [Neoconidiobolus thromboides FSU 785]|nr:ankyrin [Neoconidiobolus thromboides FSU 785]
MIYNEGIENVFDTHTSYSKLSLLHLASSYNHISICQYLIENGANVNPQDREGWTPLHCAAAEGHESIVKYLITIPDISINILNNDDESPCDVCSQEYIRTLLKGKFQIIIIIIEND